MDEKTKQNLNEAGINVEEALERFMGNEMLMVRFLKKFLDDENFPKLARAVEEKNWQEALTASHTLKGVCGNLSMKKLYDLTEAQVRFFREENWQEAADMMPQLSREYEKVCGALRLEL